MLKNRDIVVHGLQSYDSTIGSNCINIANHMANNNRVLYVNYPIDRITLLRHSNNPLVKHRKKVLAGDHPGLVKISNNIWNLNPRTILESVNKIGFHPVFRMVNKINSKRYAAEIKKAIENLGFRDIIFFNDSDFYRAFHFKELLAPSLSVYYTRDNMRATNFFRRFGARYEDALMKKSDLIVSNSMYLNDIAAKANPASVYVGQGCDTSLFNRDIVDYIPDDIKNIKKPVIGYIGALKSTRLDIDVLQYIAENKPSWNIVLIGPEDDTFKNSALHKIKNVFFLGSKKEAELPIYLNAFDVAINPQSLNKLTIGNYPRKIDEYLAMGKPVVATRTITMGVFEEHTYLASTKKEYIELIQRAIDENNDNLELARISFARTHTWQNNVDEIYKAIINIEK